jgi:hypothetical protein
LISRVNKSFLNKYHVEAIYIVKNNSFEDNPFIKLNHQVFIKQIPNVEDLISCSKWISDKKINYQIERLLKLKAFL